MKIMLQLLLVSIVIILALINDVDYDEDKDHQTQGEIVSAVLSQDTEKLRRLIKDGADVSNTNPKNGSGFSLLELTQGNVEITKLLLENGADPNWDPLILHEYCNNFKNPELVRLLITYGADINYVNPYTGDTPLHRAMYMYRKEIVKLLIESGADLSIKNKDGQTPVDVVKSKTDDGRKEEMIVFLDSMDIKT